MHSSHSHSQSHSRPQSHSHINDLTNNSKKSVNIIVVGGYNLANQDTVQIVDIETWNNPTQCKYSDMVYFKTQLQKEGYDVSISAFDPVFPETKNNIEIPHYKDNFNLNNESLLSGVTYYKNNAINIVISFCPIPGFDDNWPNKGNPPEFDKVKHFDIRYIVCGCMWENGFPTDTIMNILEYDLKTPLQKT